MPTHFQDPAVVAVVYNVEDYGAVGDGLTESRTAIQACIDACEAAGGGIVRFGAGRFKISPIGNGYGIWHDGALSILEGSGEATELYFVTATSTGAFGGICPRNYNNVATPYGGKPIHVRDMKLTCDFYKASQNANAVNYHDGIVIMHCPWAIVERVGFEQGYYHAAEINVSKNVVVRDCYVYGTGNFQSSILELDSMGQAGIGDTSGGTLSTSTPIENILIERFIQRVPRTDLTLDPTYGFLLLSHSNAAGVYRNVRIQNCRIVPHNNSSVPSGTTRTEIGWDTSALPAECSGLYIRNNVWTGGGLTGTTICLDVSLASSSSINLRDIVIEGNLFDCPHGFAIRAGAISSATNPRTSITEAILRSHNNIVIRNNVVRVGLDGNSNSTRATRSIWVGACRHAIIENNAVLWPDTAVGSGWGSSSAATTNFAFWIDHPQNLDMRNNHVSITRPQTGGTGGTWVQLYPYAFAAAAYEIQTALSGHWNVTGNTAIGDGNIGVNLAAPPLYLITSGTTGMPQWSAANLTSPRISGYWAGNQAIQTGTGTFTHTLASPGDYFIPAAAIGNTTLSEAAAALIGAHDWRPNASDIGCIVTKPAGATASPGWQLHDGTLVTALGWLQEANWNIRLGLAATLMMPIAANTYVRLDGQ